MHQCWTFQINNWWLFHWETMKFGFITSLSHVNLPDIHRFLSLFENLCLKKKFLRYQKLSQVRLSKNMKYLTESLLRFCFFCYSFRRPFLLCNIKYAWLTPHSVSVCVFVHEINTLETQQLNARFGNVFQINIRKK